MTENTTVTIELLSIVLSTANIALYAGIALWELHKARRQRRAGNSKASPYLPPPTPPTNAPASARPRLLPSVEPIRVIGVVRRPASPDQATRSWISSQAMRANDHIVEPPNSMLIFDPSRHDPAIQRRLRLLPGELDRRHGKGA